MSSPRRHTSPDTCRQHRNSASSSRKRGRTPSIIRGLSAFVLQGGRAIYERWEWNGEVVGRLFGTGFKKEQPLIAVIAAGCIPYFSKLPALDLFGLNDRHIAHTTPVQIGTLAHDHGDGKYALDLKPDLILMNVNGGPLMFLSGRQMARDKRFARHYRPVPFEGYTPFQVRTVPFVRIDGKVGIRYGKSDVHYPPYLLSGENILGILGPEGDMMTRLPARTRLTSEKVRLSTGRWRVETVPSIPGLEARIIHRCDGRVFVHEQMPEYISRPPATLSSS